MITKLNFMAYEEVRKSGKTNMYNISNVVALSGLTKEQVLNIIENYEFYLKEFKIR